MLFALVACGPPQFIAPDHFETSALSQPEDPAFVRKVIIEALNRRRARVEGEESNVVHAAIESGQRTLRLAIRYDERGIELRPTDMSGFDTVVDPATGTTLVHDEYLNWIRQLKKTIDRQLVTERQARADDERRVEENALREARANANAEQARLEREQLARQPVVVQQSAPVANVQPSSADSLRSGFNIVRAPNGLGPATMVIVNRSTNSLTDIRWRRHGDSWRPAQRGYLSQNDSHTTRNIPPGTWDLRMSTGV